MVHIDEHLVVSEYPREFPHNIGNSKHTEHTRDELRRARLHPSLLEQQTVDVATHVSKVNEFQYRRRLYLC